MYPQKVLQGIPDRERPIDLRILYLLVMPQQAGLKHQAQALPSVQITTPSTLLAQATLSKVASLVEVLLMVAMRGAIRERLLPQVIPLTSSAMKA